jgi:maltooligosyltrehalose trehalohydrolase
VPSFPFERRLGAFPLPGGGAELRVWAPRPGDALRVLVGGREHALEDAGYGIREAVVEAEPGADYAYVIEGIEFPDPCSRWQPDGLRGPSRLLDTGAFEWSDESFAPASLRDAVIYELHVGTFTPEGTFDAAAARLDELARLGVTHVEVMPVAEFPGRHGWGYDGVYLSAAQSSYGGPPAFQRFVDAAHGAGLGVILDVVYNHVGASGAQALEAFGPYFTDKHETFWGRALNFDDAGCDPVREWVLQSAEGWLRDFHLDGLRLDAIHAIADDSPEHLVAAVARRAHAAREGAVVIAESGLNDPKVMRPAERGGWGCDAAWADDFHHAFRALATGERDGWYADFGRVADLAKAFHRPYVHDGTFSPFRDRRFGAPAEDVPPQGFVVFSANHDQVGNRALGDRLPVEVRPLAVFLTLLSPFVPMLFQGEEHGERAPFQFFSDHIDEDIAVATREGRRREFAAFAQFAGEEVPDPQDPGTFARSKLTGEGEPPGLRDLHARLIAARREIGPGDAEAIDFDEHKGWLRVRRGGHTALTNLSRADVHVPVDGTLELVLATHHATVEPGYVVLPPLAGALLR